MVTTKSRLIVILIGLTMLGGCSLLPTNMGRLEGHIWCNERYLDMVKEYEDPSNAGEAFRKKLQLSREGYIYAVAGVLALQKKNKDTQFNFTTPPRLKLVDEQRHLNGFHAETYILHHPDTHKATEAIIAFRGSDQWRDYFLHNFSILPAQLKPAREYVKRISKHPSTQGLNLIATGYSLGGGLAVHVTKHQETTALISQAWAFNPTPRVGVSKGTDPRIFLLSTSYEILRSFDRTSIGALPAHTMEDFGLVRSSSIYSHYRWVLARQILFYADLALFLESGRSKSSTEPLEILQSQKITACSRSTQQSLAEQRAHDKPTRPGDL